MTKKEAFFFIRCLCLMGEEAKSNVYVCECAGMRTCAHLNLFHFLFLFVVVSDFRMFGFSFLYCYGWCLVRAVLVR